MTTKPVLAAALLFVGACESAAPPEPPSAATEPTAAVEPAPAPAPAANDHPPSAPSPHAPLRTTDDGARVFGAELSAARPVTPLATLMAEPARFAGQVVKTEGVITQVCQRMGCWMEMRPGDEEGPSVRVPMGGHSFFLPRDVSGHRCTVEGTVEVEALDEGTREHLRSEGAEATDQSLSVVASAVLVR